MNLSENEKWKERRSMDGFAPALYRLEGTVSTCLASLSANLD